MNLLVALLLITPFNLDAQNRTFIVDSSTKKPISDVYLYHKINQKIVLLAISNEDGSILLPSLNLQDTLYVSHISYKKRAILKSGIQNSNSIELSPFEVNLEEISIIALNSNRVKQFGYFRQKGKRVLCSSTPDWIIGNIINIDTSIKLFKIRKLLCEFDKIIFCESKKIKLQNWYYFPYF